MDGKTLREAIGPCFALLLRGYDYAGYPDELVLTAIVDKLMPMFEDLEGKRAEAIQTGLALVVERDEAREHLKKVSEVVIGIPWGLGIRFDSMNLAASLQARVDAAVAQLAEAEIKEVKAVKL